jgi:hypothetical protein
MVLVLDISLMATSRICENISTLVRYNMKILSLGMVTSLGS